MSDLAKARFEKAVRARVLPLLKGRGFKGTWPTFRLVLGKSLAHVIGFQATQLAGGGVYVNLGVYLAGLDEGRPKERIDAIRPYACVIRERLQNLAGVSDIFPYGATEEETAMSVAGLVEMLEVEGFYFLDRFDSYPDAFAERVKDAAKHGLAYIGPLAPEARCAAAETYAKLAILLDDGPSLDALIKRIRMTWSKERGKAFADEIAAYFEAERDKRKAPAKKAIAKKKAVTKKTARPKAKAAAKKKGGSKR